jgi:ribose 1,5-bisphosphokinase PhnN
MKMNLNLCGKRFLLCALVFSTTAVCTQSGWAMLAPAQSAPAAGGQAYDRAADMKAVQTALESKIVRERLKALGMNDKEIDSRLSKLSDQQVHKLARDVKTLSPGGGVIGLLEMVVLVLLIIILLRAV